jgi:phosphoribosyl 1,2-cyclic phosphodiesterase
MAVTICVLGSGSTGNCTFIGTDTTGVFVDAGLSCKETLRRAEEAGLPAGRVCAVLLTHEHADHTAGISVLHRRHKLALYANSGTIDRFSKDEDGERLQWNVFQTGAPFDLGDLKVEPFSVPHDALDPVGFIFTVQGLKIGVVTDMGMATTLIRERLRRCHALVVEANHDLHMLKNSGRPWTLIQRILSRQGHLSNEALAEMLGEIGHQAMTDVFLAHLSQDCNDPALAEKDVRKVLDKRGHSHIRLHLTYPDKPSHIIRLG